MAALERTLAEAETQLGLLGWQQAEYDEDTQRQVREIQGVEREQSRLTNEGAAISNEIRRIQEERQSRQREYDEAKKRLEAELKRVREPIEALERQLAEIRKVEPNFVKHIPELDRELRELQRLYSELLTRAPQTPQIRQELLRLRERIVAIPNEKSDLRTQHLRAVSEMRAIEERVEEAQPAVRSVQEQIQSLDEKWSATDRELGEQMAVKTAERKRLDSAFEEMETAKANPYQRIGRVLAANNVAPVNQPEALEKVKQLQFELGQNRQVILEADAAGSKEDAKALLISKIFWWAMLLAAIVVGVLAIRP